MLVMSLSSVVHCRHLRLEISSTKVVNVADGCEDLGGLGLGVGAHDHSSLAMPSFIVSSSTTLHYYAPWHST